MDALAQILLDYGYGGMWLASFLAGTVFPFSSELVLVALVRMGLNPMLAILCATFGNVVGGMTCYGLGRLGNMHWIEKYLKVNPAKLERARQFLQGRGAWMAFFCFIPFWGETTAIVLGLMRSNLWITLVAMALGKFCRYAVLVYLTEGLVSLF